MKKRIRSLLPVGFSLLAALVSCLPEPLIVDDVPAARSKIVVSSELLPDGSLVVVLTRSFSALEVFDETEPETLVEQLAITDAMVTVTGPRGVDTLFQVDDGIYLSRSLAPNPGETYSFHAESPTMGVATAVTTVMQPVRFESVRVDLVSHAYVYWVEIEYSAFDLPQQNYYLLTVQKLQHADFTKNILKEPVFSHLVVDSKFNGEEFSGQFIVLNERYAAADTIVVSIANVSKAFFDFMTLRTNNQSSIVEYLSEPVNYPTNIVGGQGFFNLHYCDRRVIKIQK